MNILIPSAELSWEVRGDEAIKQYFPLDSTIEGLIQIYEKFFDIRIASLNCNHLWHEDVKLLGIYQKQAKGFR
mgnify:CR=1 FL=1